MVHVSLERQNEREAIEVLRHALVHCMRSGDRFVIYVDKLCPDFKTQYNFPPSLWPSDKIFDFKNWRYYDNYMKVVKEDENHDLLMNKNKFFMTESFQIIFLKTYTDDEDIKNCLD